MKNLRELIGEYVLAGAYENIRFAEEIRALVEREGCVRATLSSWERKVLTGELGLDVAPAR